MELELKEVSIEEAKKLEENTWLLQVDDLTKRYKIEQLSKKHIIFNKHISNYLRFYIIDFSKVPFKERK